MSQANEPYNARTLKVHATKKGPPPKVRPFSNAKFDDLEKLRAVVFHVGVGLDGLVNLAVLLLGALLGQL